MYLLTLLGYACTFTTWLTSVYGRTVFVSMLTIVDSLTNLSNCISSLTRPYICTTISSHLVPNIITHLFLLVSLHTVADCHLNCLPFTCCSCLPRLCFSFCYVDTHHLDDVLDFLHFVILPIIHHSCCSFLLLFPRSNVCPCLHLSISVCINLHFSFCYDISLVTNVKCLKNFFLRFAEKTFCFRFAHT